MTSMLKQPRRTLPSQPFSLTQLHTVFASPHYRQKLGKGSYTTWDQLPFTTKAELRSSYPDGLLSRSTDFRVASYHESSGTTGSPTATYLSDTDWDQIITRFLQGGINLTADDWTLIKTPYSLVTTAHQMEAACRKVGAAIVPASNRTSNISYPKVIRLLRDLPISVTWSLPSEICYWHRVAQWMGLDPREQFPQLRALWVAGEPLSNTKKAFLERAWGRPIYRDYGSTETGSLAGECTHGNIHLWSDSFEAEIADGTRSTLLKGATEGTLSGELVVTLRRQAMPLLRYRTGDRVTASTAPCACGSPLPTIEISGRLSEKRHPTVAQVEDILFSEISADRVPFWKAILQSEGVEFFVDEPELTQNQAALEELFQMRVTMHYKSDLMDRNSFLKSTPPFLKPQYIKFQEGAADADSEQSLEKSAQITGGSHDASYV